MISYFEWLDDYLDGSLSQEDRLAFEKAMVSDEKLKHAVDNYNLLKKISASLIEEETRENLSAISEEKHKPTPVRKLFRWWLVAGAVIFIG
jgi:anti-sigma factor RsiW